MARDINLTSEKWIDMIFEDKNKAYGAYMLRINSPRRHTFAFLIVLLGAALVISVSTIVSAYHKAKEVRDIMTEVFQLSDLNLIKPDEPIDNVQKYIPPEPVEFKSTIQFTVPTIKKDELVNEANEIKSNEELVKSDITISAYDVIGTNEETGIDKKELDENHSIGGVEKTESNEVVDWAEQQPTFPGGNDALMEFLNSHIKYPAAAVDNGSQGQVTLQFIVGKDGSIEDVIVARGVDRNLDNEAVRVVKSMPKWIPGRQGGVPVRVKYYLPVTFRLQ